MNEVSILGLGASGHAAARLVLHKGKSAYVSEASDNATASARGAELRKLGAEVDLGGHDLERIARSDTVVVSPGIPHDAPVLVELRARGVRWISEPEFAARFFRGSLIAVTGTNGKTTTCALTAHLLRSGGASVGLGGNIGAGLGPAASELALLDPAPDWYVVEMSSFQLADIDRFRPDIGVLTNLAPDHLDRYISVEEYYGDKARLYENADAGSAWVLNADDERAKALAEGAPGERWFFSTGSTAVRGGWVDNEVLMLSVDGVAVPILPRADLPLLGTHNVSNALAALVTAYVAGVSIEDIARGLRSAPSLPHRLETVSEIGGVLWVNDSKATNVAAAVSAIRSLEGRSLVVLLGGKDKGEDFSALEEPLRRFAHSVLVYGQAAGRIAESLEVPVEHVSGGFEAVVDRAAGLARSGDAVLLAPACSSFDMFSGYQERGERFTELVLGRASRGQS